MIIGAFNDEPNRDTKETGVTALGSGLVGITLFFDRQLFIITQKITETTFHFSKVSFRLWKKEITIVKVCIYLLTARYVCRQ